MKSHTTIFISLIVVLVVLLLIAGLNRTAQMPSPESFVATTTVGYIHSTGTTTIYIDDLCRYKFGPYCLSETEAREYGLLDK